MYNLKGSLGFCVIFSNWAAACPKEVWSEKHLFSSSLMAFHECASDKAIMTFCTGPADLPRASVLMFLPL